MRPGYGVRIPTPPPFHNKGNWIFSLAQLGRHLAEQAEELGAMVLPETDAQTLLVSDGAVRGVVTGDKGLGRDGEPSRELRARRRDPCAGDRALGGHPGPPDGGAHRGLRPALAEPAGVEPGREGAVAGRAAARPRHPHAGVAAAGPAKYGESGGSFIYPMGEDQIALGLVVGLDYRDASLSVHDLLQEFKPHPLIRPLLEGGERIGWGAKTIPEGGLYRCRRACRCRAP